MRTISACLLFVSGLACASAARADPCRDLSGLSTRADAEACVDAFIADPAAPPDLGAGGSNVLGVNHRLGDLSFILAFGRKPNAADPDALRMRTHLELALRILRARSATAPALAPRRALILEHLATYRDKGAVPENAHVGRRNPVFIDDAGRICAVGYLIEQTAGRELAEAVAERFRYAYIGQMQLPALAAWVADSGLSAAELALIQPAYSLPTIESQWTTFVGPLRLRIRAPDGPFTVVDEWKRTTRGAWKRGHMDGHWERRDADGAVIGAGDFVAGRGTWRAVHPGGRVAAEGTFANDAPAGAWRAFYPSGHPSIEGHFANALRSGRWTYYFDGPEKPVMARGEYRHVEVGLWEHYDREGRHIATSDTRRGSITWYDARGEARAAEAAAFDDGSHGDAVAWDPETKRVERARFDLFRAGQDLRMDLAHAFGEVEVDFDGAGHLTGLVVRESGGQTIAVAFASVGGRTDAVAAWSHKPAPSPEDAIIATPITPDAGVMLAASPLVTHLEQAARRANGKPRFATARKILKAIDAFLVALDKAPRGADTTRPPAPAARAFAPLFPARAPHPALVQACPDGETTGGPSRCIAEPWAALTDPAAQIQAAVLHTPTMVTSGTNFVHLDAIAGAMMAFMPDRVPESYDPEYALPAWWTMPAFQERENEERNLFGQYSSSHAPMLGLR